MLALAAARTLPQGHPLTSRALALAGQAACFEGRGADALGHYSRSEETSATIGTRRRALWGQFLTLLELDDPEAGSYSRLVGRWKPAPEDILRLATGRYQLALRRGKAAFLHSWRISRFCHGRLILRQGLLSSMWSWRH